MNEVNFNKVINRHNTYCTQWDYISDRFGSDDVLPFSISDMDFEIAPVIKNAITKRVEHGVFGYSRWQNGDFEKAIHNWFSKKFKANIKTTNIAYSPSIIYSLSYFIETYTSVGDGIIIHLPTYTDFCTITEDQKRVVLASHLYYNEQGKACINFSELEELAKKAKLLVWCAPHNPTGRVWTIEESQKMLDIAEKYNLWVISDEAHMDITHVNHPHISLARLWKNYAKCAVITSTAKGFNTPSLGGSYIIFNDDTVINKFVSKQKMRGLNSPAILGVIATITAYNQAENWLNELNRHISNNYLYVKNRLVSEITTLSLSSQEGTYFAWINTSRLNLSSSIIKKQLVEIGKVGIMGGDTYFAQDGHYLRLNLACSKSKLEEGVNRLIKSLI